MKLFTKVLAFALALSACIQAMAKDAPMIILDPNDVLYIRVMDNIYNGGNERDRFHQLENTLEETLIEVEFPMRYKIVRFGARTPSDMPLLDLTIMQWGGNGLNEIEVRFGATLRESKETRQKNRLGIFKFTDARLTGAGSEQARIIYNDVLRRALVELTRELYTHFNIEPELLDPAEE